MAEAKKKKATTPKTKKVVKAAVKQSPKTVIVAINKMQYVVKEGETIKTRIGLDSQAEDVEVKLLAVVDGENFTYGTPYLANKLNFELGGVVLGEKVTAFKYKSKARYRRKVGFRQKFVEFKLNSVN